MNAVHTNSKTFQQPVEVTEALRKQYVELKLTDDQARTILSNTTTHIVLKREVPGAGPVFAEG